VDNAADGEERTSLLLRSSTSNETAETEGRTNHFMKKERFSTGQKTLVKANREQGATVTAPRSNGSNPARILGTRHFA
jgi:hypothetical protein